MKYVARYAIVRFLPYAETGEFANIGVVFLATGAKFFGYKFLETGTRRVTAFFEPMDPHVFRHARSLFLRELGRVQVAIEKSFCEFDYPPFGGGHADRLFDEFTRRRESAVYLSPVRVVTSDNPAEKLTFLFEQYVQRAFTSRATHDIELTQHVHAILERKNLSRFYRQVTLGTDDFPVQFPLVSLDKGGMPVSAIKPLHLGHIDPTRLYRHGWEWAGRLRKLRRDRKLPADVLFAIKGPDVDSGPRLDNFLEVVDEIRKSEVVVVKDDDDALIEKFAVNSIDSCLLLSEPNDLLG